jgi:xylulokinase
VILAVDIGTSTFKAAIFSPGGICRGQTAIPLRGAAGTEGAADGGGTDGEYELEPGLWLAAFEEALPRLGDLGGLEALVVSGTGPTLVPVTGTPGIRGGGLSLPAGRARLWLDRRAREESAKVSELSGAYVDPGFFIPKALWIKNREAGLYEKTRHFFAAPEYLVYALTGEARTVFPSAGFERWYWDQGLLGALELDPAKFPSFVSPGEFIGTPLATAASRLGLPPGLKVFAGGPDFFVTILGAGVTRAGQACDRSGTSEGVNLCTGERIMDGRLMSYGHPVKPLWNLSGIISTSGRAIDWARELLGMEGLPYGDFYGLAAKAPPGSRGLIFLPYLAGERAPCWDPHARGVFQGLSLATGRAELARAVAEGVCFAIRDVITVMEECGAPAEETRLTGGPAESFFLNQLKADIGGRPALLPVRRDAELVGLAAIGAAALGNYSSFGEASAALVKIERVFEPRKENAARYEDRFGMYRELYRALKPQFAAKY